MIVSTVRAYLFSVAVSGEAVINVAYGGTDGMTLSARAGYARAIGKRWGHIVCRVLDSIHCDHCRKAIDNDIARNKALLVYLQMIGKRL